MTLSPSSEDASGDDSHLSASTGTRRRRSQHWLLWSGASAVLALIFAAGAGGWWLANVTLVASSASEEVVETPTTDDIDLGLEMPDVRGLDLATAQQVLADSGIPVSVITTHDAPSVALAGVVVEQSPAFGATEIDLVDLGLAVAVTMPNLIGTSQNDAVQTLSGLGTSVTVAFAYSRDAKPGAVIAVDPAVGAPLSQTASMTVATSGSTLPLGRVTSRSGGRCSADDDVTIDGIDFAMAVLCPASPDRVSDTTWVLSKTVDRFTATVGIPDDGAPGSSVPFQVLLDGTAVASGTAAYGALSRIDVTCTDAIQLTIRIGTAPASQTGIGFGDALVYGSEEAVARLSGVR